MEIDQKFLMAELNKIKACLDNIARTINGEQETKVENTEAIYTNDSKMPFGKYKGKPLGSLPTDYLNWMLEQPKMADPRLSNWLKTKKKEAVSVPSEFDDDVPF